MAAAFFTPFAGNPFRTVMRWAAIVAINPDIVVPVVAVITGDPDITFARSRNNFDGARGRGTDAYYDLRTRDADAEKEAAGCNEKLFLHESFSLILLTGRTRVGE
jgi:hypothetical protein